MLNNKGMLKKLVMGLIALFFILTGSLLLLMGYVFNKPASVFNAFTSVTDIIMQGQKYEATEEFFLQGIEKLSISSRLGDIELKTHTGPTLKVLVSGQVPRFEQGPFLEQNSENENLSLELHEPVASQWVQMNVNGHELTHQADSHLKLVVFLPISYKKYLSVDSRDGSIHIKLPKTEPYELESASQYGKIENSLKFEVPQDVDPAKIGKIEVKTVKGNIKIEAE